MNVFPWVFEKTQFLTKGDKLLQGHALETPLKVVCC